MGADITFYEKDGKAIFYFRDAYNDANLAWKAGLSYWQTKGTLKNAIAFFEKLGNIDDAPLEQEETSSIRKVLFKKRDEIKQALPAIRKASRVVWAV